MKSYPGRFISFEGGDGTGKTTQIKRLIDTLKVHGIECVATREPGGSPGAEEIRELLVTGKPGRWDALSETLLLFAARHDHIEQTIRPALKTGNWVITDRFTDSTYAYQGAGGGLNRETIRRIEAVSIEYFKPDLTIVLDLPPETGLARTHKRDDATSEKESRFEQFELDFHTRLHQGYLDIAKRERDRCVVIDASQPVEEIAAAVFAVIAERFSIS